MRRLVGQDSVAANEVSLTRAPPPRKFSAISIHFYKRRISLVYRSHCGRSYMGLPTYKHISPDCAYFFSYIAIHMLFVTFNIALGESGKRPIALVLRWNIRWGNCRFSFTHGGGVCGWRYSVFCLGGGVSEFKRALAARNAPVDFHGRAQPCASNVPALVDILRFNSLVTSTAKTRRASI